MPFDGAKGQSIRIMERISKEGALGTPIIAYLVGVLVDFLISLAMWLVLLSALAAVVAKVRGLPVRRHLKYAAIASLVIAAAVAGATLLRGLAEMSTTQFTASSAETSGQPRAPADTTRLRAIVLEVIEADHYPGEDLRTEFWRLADKSGHLSSEQQQDLRDTMIGASTVYMRLFYEDALWALKTGRPFKSLERERYEKRLFSIGAISEWRIQENERVISQIASKQPIQSVVLDEERINGILAGLHAAGKRLELLFTRP